MHQTCPTHIRHSNAGTIKAETYQKAAITENPILPVASDGQDVIAHAESAAITANNFSDSC